MSLITTYEALWKEKEEFYEENKNDVGAKVAIGINNKGNFVTVSKKVVHRAIVGITGAGKTTLAQSLKEIDLHRKRKVVEIEPALEGKCEAVFMNLPNDEKEMVKVLKEDFGLEPKGFETIAYTPNTQKYKQFIQKYPEMEKFFKPIQFKEEDLIRLLPKILPSGPIERLLLASYIELLGNYSLNDLVNLLEEEGTPGFMSQTIMKIRYLASIGLISDEGVSIKDMLKGKHASVITFAFVDDPLDRFIMSFIYLSTIYETWKEMTNRKRFLSFFVADANLFAPNREKDQLDSLSRYQQRARAQLQIYSRISRAQGLAWTLDFQTWRDIDPVVLGQMKERFFKRSWSEEIAKMLGVDPYHLRKLGKKYAYFHNMETVQKIKVRPPRSRKAKEGQFTPEDFAQEYRRFEDEEATHTV